MKEALKKLGIILLIICAASSIILAVTIAFNTAKIEMGNTYTADAPLYWTVGRGILNGIKPYSGLYENKPIGIFLISALSFKLTGGISLCDAFCTVCLIVTGIIPGVYAAELYIKKRIANKNTNKNLNKNTSEINKIDIFGLGTMVFAIVTGLCIMMYSEIRSGYFQVESMGAAFVILYVWAAFHIEDFKKSRLSYIIWNLVAAISILGSIMLKEPFIVIAFASVMLLVYDFKGFMQKVFFPMLEAGVIYLVLLLASGMFKPYMTIYISNMFSNHISNKGSPLVRSFDIKKIILDFRKLSRSYVVLVGILIVICILSNIILYKKNKKKINKKINKKNNIIINIKIIVYEIIKLFVCIYLVSFVVGLGGQYYSHHYAFAVPFYSTLIMVITNNFIKFENDNKLLINITYVIIILVSCIALRFDIINKDLSKTYLANSDGFQKKYEKLCQDAQKMDNLLDYYGEESYQVIGFNGEDKFYGLTKHSPMGPVFVQDPDDFCERKGWFLEQYLNQLNTANVLIFYKLNTPAIDKEVKDIIENDFTDNPENRCPELDELQKNGYEIYIRKEKF